MKLQPLKLRMDDELRNQLANARKRYGVEKAEICRRAWTAAVRAEDRGEDPVGVAVRRFPQSTTRETSDTVEVAISWPWLDEWVAKRTGPELCALIAAFLAAQDGLTTMKQAFVPHPDDLAQLSLHYQPEPFEARVDRYRREVAS